MHQPYMVQRYLARFEVEPDGLRVVYLDRDFLAAGQQVVLGERVAMRNLVELGRTGISSRGRDRGRFFAPRR